MRRLVRCGTTLVDSILGGAALQRCEKTYPPPRTGRARLQEPALSGAEGCHPAPIKKRALAPEGLGRLPRKPLAKDCHPERSEGSAVRRRGEPCVVWHAAEQLNLPRDFGWRSASALRKDLPSSTNGKGTASAVPPRANKEAGLSPRGSRQITPEITPTGLSS
jgi:hypothetical protein